MKSSHASSQLCFDFFGGGSSLLSMGMQQLALVWPNILQLLQVGTFFRLLVAAVLQLVVGFSFSVFLASFAASFDMATPVRYFPVFLDAIAFSDFWYFFEMSFLRCSRSRPIFCTSVSLSTPNCAATVGANSRSRDLSPTTW